MADVKIDFFCNGQKTTIQSKSNEKMKDIIDKVLIKLDKTKDSIYFIYGGKYLNEDLTFEEIANSQDKERKTISVITYDIEKDTNSKREMFKLSKNIICPDCKEDIILAIKDYKITLFDCKNGHKRENILLKDFDETQNIDESLIFCDDCKAANKSTTYQNRIYKCNTCQQILCPLCRNKHDKTHYIIDYEQKFFICNIHNDLFFSYCQNCKKNICLGCEKEHVEHKIITFGRIMPDMNQINKQLTELKSAIDKYKKDINEIISTLNNLIQNLDYYYSISFRIVNNYEIKNRNYSIFQNIEAISNSNKNLINDINNITNETSIPNKFNKMLNMYNSMSPYDKSFNVTPEEFNNDINDQKNIIKEKEIKNEEKPEIKLENKEQEINIDFKLDSSNDKYDNFNICRIKEIKSFKSEKYSDKNNSYEKLIYIILKDGRLLTYQPLFDEKYNLWGICVYDPKNNFNCDIKREIYIKGMIQNDDGTIIIMTSHTQYKKLLLMKIEEKNFKVIQTIDIDYSFFLFRLSNKKFVKFREYSKIIEYTFYLYSYENNKIVIEKDFGDKKENIEYIYDICLINENEIALICKKKGRVYGSNYWLIFYNITRQEKISDIKLCDENDSKNEIHNLFLLNKKYLLGSGREIFNLFNITTKSLEKKITKFFDYNFMVSLNDENFLSVNYDEIIQFEIDSDIDIKIVAREKYKSKYKFRFDYVGKFPGNKLIMQNRENIIIFDY